MNDSPIELVIITDPGTDNDDEVMLLLAAFLEQSGSLNIRAVAATGEFADRRGLLAHGTLRRLRVMAPVAIGHQLQTRLHPPDSEAPYVTNTLPLGDAQELLTSTFRLAQPHSITVLCTAMQSTLAQFIADQPHLFKEKVNAVVLMSGIEQSDGKPILEHHKLIPDSAANNQADMHAAKSVFCKIQELEVPLTIVTRFAAYQCPFSPNYFSHLERIGHPVGIKLARSAKSNLLRLWKAANETPEYRTANGIPPRCDRNWFVETFIGQEDPGLKVNESPWSHIKKIYLYDPIALTAAIPSLFQKFFAPRTIRVGNADHNIVGINSLDHGIQDPEGLSRFIMESTIAVLEEV